jgi:hypothetical protein
LACSRSKVSRSIRGFEPNFGTRRTWVVTTSLQPAMLFQAKNVA